MKRVILCLGSNLGNRQFNLLQSLNLISNKIGNIVKQSGVYESKSWGYKSEQKFLNQIIVVETKLNPNTILKKNLEIEKIIGRIRKDKSKTYEDRLIDIDILFIDDKIINSNKLTIPHLRLQERNFVLQPLSEICENYSHPVYKKSIKYLLQNSKDRTIVNRIKHYKYICIEGNIGAGKSTLAKALTKTLNATYIPEQFEHSIILPLFYNEPKKYAYALELEFLYNRFKQLQTIDLTNKIIISDYCFKKCLWFAKNNLTTKEYSQFKLLFNKLEKLLPKPDIIIHLKPTVKALKTNINKRGRVFERAISTNYLNNINKIYSDNLNSEKLKIEVLPINLMKFNENETKKTVSFILKKTHS